MRPLDRRVPPHLAPARRPLVGVLVGNVVAGLLVVAQAFAAAALVVAVLGESACQEPAAWFFATVLARAGVGWAVDVAASRAAGLVGIGLRRRVMEAVLDEDGGALRGRRTGELATLATKGVAAVEPYLTRYLPALVLAGVLPVVTVVAIATQDLASSVIVLATLPLVPVFAALIGMATQERADRQWRALTTLAGHFLDVVRGLPTLVAHRRARHQVPVIRAVTERHRRASMATLRLAFASSAALELIATISVALVAVWVGLRLATGGLDLQTALTVLLLAPEAYWPLRRVGAEYHAAAEGTATFDAISALPSRHELPAFDRRVVTSSRDYGVESSRTPAPVHLDRLSLGWPGGLPVIENLTATIPARGITALVGPSGCGKSTLLQALLGELAPSRGQLRAGDQPITASPAWRGDVAQVPQRPWLTAGSIAENLRIGRADATDAQLWRALELVDLGLTVAALPDGLASRLGDDGLGLSAGQRARLALARVVLSDRPYVVLDEPTAHLDAASERTILTVLRHLAQSRTVVVVAHRSSVIAAAETVIDLGGNGSSRRLGENPRELVTTRRGSAGVRDDSTPKRREFVTTRGEIDGSSRRLGGRWALAVVLGVLAAASGVALTATAGWLIARSAEQPPILALTVAIVGVRTFGLARPALRYAERLVSHDVALRLLADRRAATYADLVGLVPGRIGRRGDLLSGVVDDVDAEVDHRLRVRLPHATWLGVVLLATATAGWILPPAAWVVLAVGLGGGLVSQGVGWAAARSHERAYVDARGAVARAVTDAVSSARQLVLWQQRPDTLARLDHRSRRLATTATAAVRASSAGSALAHLSAGAGVVAMAAIGAPALTAGDVSGPMLALLILLPLALGEVTMPLAESGALRVRTRAARTRLRALADAEPVVADPDQPATAPDGTADLLLDDVHAGWPDSGPTLPGVRLELTRSRHLGITGPSGCGKSTLALVLLRLLPVSRGRYRLGGVDTARLTGDDVRRRVGLIDDDPYLFGSTVAENVRLARPDADDADVEAALRAAHLGPWLDGLPDGLATRIGDGGREVSGGERARIGIARVLLADHPVLVLDEPTAHLDSATAREVARDLVDAARDRTLVWIAHDRVGLDRMDQVVTLPDLVGSTDRPAGQRSDLTPR